VLSFCIFRMPAGGPHPSSPDVDAAFLIGGRRGAAGAAGGSAAPRSVETERDASWCFLCHGFAEHCGYFHQLAEPLAAAGFLAYGHGLSEGNVNQLRSIDTLVDVAAAHLAKLKLEFPDCIVYGVGAHWYCTECAAGGPQPPLSAMVWLSPALQPAGNEADEAQSAAQQVALPAATSESARCPGGRFRPKISPGARRTRPGSITLPTLPHHGHSRPHRRSGSICRFCVRAGQALGKPVTGRAYLGARHQLHTDLL
uniref:Hydrolase_4 domain-containing protein n=1 Tax=Macrostomum lignano TaxID=282301 RepID=A0A1I8F8S6_9PLAT